MTAAGCCSRNRKCVNETDFTKWTNVSLGAGGTITKEKTSVHATSNNLGVIGVQDLNNFVNPNKDFSLRTTVQQQSGSEMFVGLNGSDLTINNPYFSIQLFAGSVYLAWGNGSSSLFEAIAVATTAAVEYVVRKVGSRVTVYADGSKLTQFTVNNAFPKSSMYPLFFVGSTGLSPVVGDMFRYCVKK